MARTLTWRSLTVGLTVAGAIVAIAAGILIFARVGALHGDTVRLYMVTDRAAGVIRGTEVWLGGQQVGLVDDVQFRSAATDTTERIAIAMDILTKYLSHIRRNAAVDLRPGGSPIGTPVVYIEIGHAGEPALREGDTLHASAQRERTSRAAAISTVGENVVGIFAGVKDVIHQTQTRSGEIGTLRKRVERQATDVGAAIEQFGARATQSQGTVSQMMHDSPLRASVERVTAQSDSIRQLLASPHKSLGRFRRDSTLFAQAQRISADMDTLRSRFGSPKTLGGTDSALTRQLDLTQRRLDSLVADAKRHPFKYLSL